MGNKLYRIIDFGVPFVDWTDEEVRKKFDPKSCIECAVRAHANAIRACATGWLGPEAYYQSAIVPKAPGVGRRDLFRELIEEARKNNLEVIAYIHVGCGGGEIAKQHPDWVARTSTGKSLKKRPE